MAKKTVEGKASAKRIYVVSEAGAADDVQPFLVRAASQEQAIGHVVRGRFSAEVATQDALVGLVAKGVVVEDAGGDS